MKEINYQSDFKLFEKGDLHTAPFEFEYRTAFSKPYKVSCIDGVYTNCKLTDDGRLMVVFDNHGLRPGLLRCLRKYYLTDKDYHDGVCHLMSDENTDIMLTVGKTDCVQAETELPPHYQQGEQGSKGDKGDRGLQGETGPQGNTGPKGDPGNDGKDLTWESMTDEQREELMGKVVEEVKEGLVTATEVTDIENVL